MLNKVLTQVPFRHTMRWLKGGRPDAISTNGLARVLLHVHYGDPATLLYRLCEPNREIGEENRHSTAEHAPSPGHYGLVYKVFVSYA